MYSISIIIPAYNEEQRLPATLEKIKTYVTARQYDYEIIVVNDGSTDKTAGVAETFKDLNLRVLTHSPNRGKGYCIKTGMLNAKKDIALFTDADLSTPIEFFDTFAPLHESGADIVIASRDIKGAAVKLAQPFFREFGGKVFNLLMRLVTGLPIHDTQCGFKSFKRETLENIFKRQTIPGFGFDVEVLYIAHKLGYKIKETPVDWFDSPATKVNFLKDSTKMFAELFKIRANDFNGLYK
ncbi:MAG: dolichyl-phosphate beta-glucosyltransferase [bacterium]